MRTTRWRQFPRVSWGSLPGHRGSQMIHRTQKYKFSLQFWELSDSCFYSLSYFEATKGYFLGEGNGTPLQYSRLENPVDGGAWWAAVHGVAKSQIRLSNFTFTFHFYVLEKEMATHSSVLAWRIPGTGEPGGLRLWDRTESDTTEATAAAEYDIW